MEKNPRGLITVPTNVIATEISKQQNKPYILFTGLYIIYIGLALMNKVLY